MLGIHTGLQPVLVSEYSDKFELIVVEVQIGNKSIRVITGYGPQESWDSSERIPFFTALEAAIVSAELEGKSVIIAIDANAKLGQKYIPNDPKEMSKNGKVLSSIIDTHALCVVNGLEGKSKGLITRHMSTVNGIEQSVIDFVIVSNELIKHIESIHIDDDRVNVLTTNHKTKTGTTMSKSDHNLIETKLNLKWNAKEAKVFEMFNFKDVESQKRFKYQTTNTAVLSNIVDNNNHLIWLLKSS